MTGLYFVDARWAYRGLPAGGLPSCTSRTAQGEGDGCVPYSYDPARGAVTVDGVTGTLGAQGMRLGARDYSPLAVPEAGAKIAGGGRFTTQTGICPGDFCTIFAVGLQLAADGSFARSAVVSGTTPGVDFGALAPDQHGTYAIEARGRIRLSFADGSVQTRTIGIVVGEDGRPDPTRGLVLDASPYIRVE